MFWMKQQYPDITLTGIDVIPELVEFGNQELSRRGVSGAKLIDGDVYAFDEKGFPDTDGVIALQTISWLPDEIGFIKTAASFDPEWIAITGLMIPGPRSFRCLVNNDDDPTNNVNYYNTFSIPYLERLFNEQGYGDFTLKPFQISIDIEKPEDESSGTYTVKTECGSRLQISGAILMNWYFMIARKLG
jgi:hypothetical protein